MIARMERVEIVFLRSEIDAMVKFLQERGVMHIEDVPLANEEFPGFLHRVHLPEAQRQELAALQAEQAANAELRARLARVSLGARA